MTIAVNHHFVTGFRAMPLKMARFASTKGEVSSSNAGATAMAMHHIGELNKLGDSDSLLEGTIARQIKQLSQLPLKDQVLYCEYTDKKWSQMDTFVKEAMRTITVQGTLKKSIRSLII